MGEKVHGFEKGDRITADVGGMALGLEMSVGSSWVVEACRACHYCRRGEELFCEHFTIAGVGRDGGFADFIK